MYCKYCGIKLDDDAHFCTQCGQALQINEQTKLPQEPLGDASQRVTEEPRQDSFAGYVPTGAWQTEAPSTDTQRESYFDGFAKQAEQDEMAGELLKGGILGLSFASGTLMALGDPFLFGSITLPLLGLIFSSKTRRRVETYTRLYGQPQGKARVGKGLALAGFITGIVGIVLTAIVTLVELFGF